MTERVRVILSCAIGLVVGFGLAAVLFLLAAPINKSAAPEDSMTSEVLPAGSPAADRTEIYAVALRVAESVRDTDFSALSQMTHPEISTNNYSYRTKPQV